MSIEIIEDLHPLHGVMAEFETAGELVSAARKARDAGYRKFDAYSPVPLHQLDEVLDLRDNRVSLFTLIGGIVGGVTGFGLCAWVEGWALPLNIGARPPVSVPMFIPITFELTILFGGLTAAISMILLNGLPQPYHPVFNVERFATASRNKFFLCIESDDPMFDRDEAVRFLESMNPEEVAEVAR